MSTSRVLPSASIPTKSVKKTSVCIRNNSAIATGLEVVLPIKAPTIKLDLGKKFSIKQFYVFRCREILVKVNRIFFLI